MDNQKIHLFSETLSFFAFLNLESVCYFNAFTKTCACVYLFTINSPILKNQMHSICCMKTVRINPYILERTKLLIKIKIRS